VGSLGGGSSSSKQVHTALPVISTSSAQTLQLQVQLCCCVSCAGQVVDLAMWLETAKMDPALTGNLLGGALLGDILHHMTAAEQAVQSSSKVWLYFTLLFERNQLGLLCLQPAHIQQAGMPQLLHGSEDSNAMSAYGLGSTMLRA
jgi:hypothetical protein